MKRAMWTREGKKLGRWPGGYDVIGEIGTHTITLCEMEIRVYMTTGEGKKTWHRKWKWRIGRRTKTIKPPTRLTEKRLQEMNVCVHARVREYWEYIQLFSTRVEMLRLTLHSTVPASQLAVGNLRCCCYVWMYKMDCACHVNIKYKYICFYTVYSWCVSIHSSFVSRLYAARVVLFRYFFFFLSNDFISEVAHSCGEENRERWPSI